MNPHTPTPRTLPPKPPRASPDTGHSVQGQRVCEESEQHPVPQQPRGHRIGHAAPAPSHRVRALLPGYPVSPETRTLLTFAH